MIRGFNFNLESLKALKYQINDVSCKDVFLPWKIRLEEDVVLNPIAELLNRNSLRFKPLLEIVVCTWLDRFHVYSKI